MILRFLQASEGGDGGCPLRPGRRWLTLPLWCPQGGLPSLSPAYPAFTFFFAPYPPTPLPRWGRGRIKVFLCKGLRPLHPRD